MSTQHYPRGCTRHLVAWRPVSRTVAVRVAVAAVVALLLAGAAGCAAPSVVPSGEGTPSGGSSAPVGAQTSAPPWVRAMLQGSAVWRLPGRHVHAKPVAAAGGASSATGGQVAIVGTVPQQDIADLGEMAVEAVRTVDGAWARPWSRRLLVVAPADRAQWESVAGVPVVSEPASSTARITQVRAKVAPAMTVDGADGNAYVVIDPEAYRAATDVGRRALLIHEAVHVAVRADTRSHAPPSSAEPSATESVTRDRPGPTGEAPMWLSEGFAQLVAYEAVGVEPHQIAGDLLGRIRREGPPATLPDEAAFTGPLNERLDAYALAWIACRTLADRVGTHAPRRAVQAGTLSAVGLDASTLTAAWRADLRRLARREG